MCLYWPELRKGYVRSRCSHGRVVRSTPKAHRPSHRKETSKPYSLGSKQSRPPHTRKRKLQGTVCLGRLKSVAGFVQKMIIKRIANGVEWRGPDCRQNLCVTFDVNQQPTTTMANKASRLYIASVGVLLIVVSLAKLWSAIGTAGILATEDPVFGIPFRIVMLVAAVIELVIGLVCLFHSSRIFSAALVAWFGTTVFLYRVGMFALGWQKPCPCLGSLTDALHLSASTAEAVVRVLLAYFIVGSFAIIAMNWLRQRRSKQLTLGAQEKPT